MHKVHRESPSYSDVNSKSPYTKYKDDLKKDFHGCCGYCGSPDFIWGGKSGFQIDHFAPKSKFPDLIEIYKNLIYACPICNRGKSNKWPSDDSSVSIRNEEGFVHPCKDEYATHLSRNEFGVITANTKVGDYMHTSLKLGLKRHQIIWLMEELHYLMKEVEKYIDKSSELKERYRDLAVEFFQYNEILRKSIDDR